MTPRKFLQARWDASPNPHYYTRGTRLRVCPVVLDPAVFRSTCTWDSIFLTRQMILLLMPGACSAVPHSPVSGNVSSAWGLPLAGPGIGSTPLLGGMSLKISFIPSGSRCPVARATTSPSCTLQTVLLCILAVHIPLCVVVSRGLRRHSSRCLSASLQLP